LQFERGVAFDRIQGGFTLVGFSINIFKCHSFSAIFKTRVFDGLLQRAPGLLGCFAMGTPGSIEKHQVGLTIF